MTVVVENIYGAYSDSNLPWFNYYGVADDEYGVIFPDPNIYNYLLVEEDGYLLQEDLDKIVL